ncbi:MAG: hypothetical protein IPM68_19315 [Flavobacteriales bacterium]|nr:hypothetical protein [Flavobacteriales bacterium]
MRVWYSRGDSPDPRLRREHDLLRFHHQLRAEQARVQEHALLPPEEVRAGLDQSMAGTTFGTCQDMPQENLDCCSPPNKAWVIEEFNKIIKPIFSQIATLSAQNQELTTLRDWLLPMLMNGQVVVGEAEEKVGLAMAAEGVAVYGKKRKA